jgi:hypothetical protein
LVKERRNDRPGAFFLDMSGTNGAAGAVALDSATLAFSRVSDMGFSLNIRF